MAGLPPFAAIPPREIRETLTPEDWKACVDAWILLTELYLGLNAKAFAAAISQDRACTQRYLLSVFEAGTTFRDFGEIKLQHLSFLLTFRMLSHDQVPTNHLQWTFISSFCKSYKRSPTIVELLQSLWKRKSSELGQTLNKFRAGMIHLLEANDTQTSAVQMRDILPLLLASSDAAAFCVIGSDLVDGLAAKFEAAASGSQSTFTAFVYTCLVALMDTPKPNFSLLSDHLYSLKTSAESDAITGARSLLSDLVTNTDIMTRIKMRMGESDSSRVRNIETMISQFRDARVARSPRPIQGGKGKAREKEGGFDESQTVHIHRMSLISQIQELFPDLGAGFVMKLLNEYNEDVEGVTAALLEDSLPPSVRALHRSEQLPSSTAQTIDHVDDLIPRSTPPRQPSPPRRKNVYDDDEFDRLAIDTTRLHIGRKGAVQTADKLLSERAPEETQKHKAAILSALAAFDADDDERDDTYDVEDVGGTVDSTVGNEADGDKNEEVLFQAWVLGPQIFGRDNATRRGQPRMALKADTGMTDEAIEGWGLMLGRDPRRLRRLEAKYASFSGQQTLLDRTAWRGSGEGDTDEEGASGSSQWRGRGRGRGPRGPSRGGRGGGEVAGPANEQNTQQARHRKEANKGSRANHNRRDQRARKMARGGLTG